MLFRSQNLLIIKDRKIRKIEFKKFVVQGSAFFAGEPDEEFQYLYLYPNKYPFMIRFHLKSEKIEYIEGVQPFNVRMVEQEWKIGGSAWYKNEIIFASPADNQFLFINVNTLETKVCSCNSKSTLGTRGIVVDGDDLWLIPFNGMTIIRWNFKGRYGTFKCWCTPGYCFGERSFFENERKGSHHC